MGCTTRLIHYLLRLTFDISDPPPPWPQFLFFVGLVVCRVWSEKNTLRVLGCIVKKIIIPNTYTHLPRQLVGTFSWRDCNFFRTRIYKWCNKKWENWGTIVLHIHGCTPFGKITFLLGYYSVYFVTVLAHRQNHFHAN